MSDDASVGTLPTGQSVADTFLHPDPTTDRGATPAAAPDGIVTIDEQGQVTAVDPAIEMLFGWTREEAVGRALDDLLQPGLHAGTWPALNQRLELPVVRPDGTELVVELVAVPTVHDGRPATTCLIRDVTELQRTQERLRESQARYEAIVRHSTKVLVLSSPGGQGSTFLAGEWLLGLPSGTPLEGGFLSLVHPDDVDAATRLMGELTAGTRGPRDGMDLRLRRSDGSHLVCNVVGEDLTALPEVGALLLRADDVTEERERERRLADTTAQMRTLIDNLGSAVLLEDDTRRVLVANDVLVDLFGIPVGADDLVGTDSTDWAHRIKSLFTDPEGFVAAVDQRVAQGFPIIGEQLSLVDGSTLERDFLPIDSAGRHAGHLWVYRDITQHIAERQMLTDQNRSLAELAALKNEFVATVSHELRTPLTSVVSFAQMLKDPSVGSLTEDQSTFLEIIDRNSQRLLRLIEDLLLVAKLESHTLPLSLGLLDLPDVVSQVVTELTPRAADRGVRLGVVTTGGPKVRGDWVRLQQVVSNLVGNAINYTLPGGSVRVTAEVLPQSSQWSIAIADTGVGIPQSEIPHVFDAFFRASSASEAAGSGAGGTGLGLAISRLIVDEHHGRISVQSPPGLGTTVTVLLPYEGA
jgi:PAS domain S-box-containing protein